MLTMTASGVIIIIYNILLDLRQRQYLPSDEQVEIRTTVSVSRIFYAIPKMRQNADKKQELCNGQENKKKLGPANNKILSPRYINTLILCVLVVFLF